MTNPQEREPTAARRSRLRFSPCAFSSLLALLGLPSCVLLLLVCLHMVAEDMASRTKTVAGHNLEPPPWHPFPVIEQKQAPLTFFRCNVLSCLRRPAPLPLSPPKGGSREPSCPAFFRSIHRDLEPWRRTRISAAMVAEAGKHAAMRVVILEGQRLFVDLYYTCGGNRAMFTIWGLLQLLRRYPGLIPDVDLMFDCMDRPSVNRPESSADNGGVNGSHLPPPPPPLFRYCTTRDHFDIPFPDWSFWGWPDINIRSWNEEFKSIKLGSQAVKWMDKDQTAHWKGNPYVQSPVREALLGCNDAGKWGAQIMIQDWAKESQSGFSKSSLSSQCNYRYKIYAEGFSWSVSLKYILACGSLALVIDSKYEDFFTRGLVPRVNFWPINSANICSSIKDAVDWGNQHPSMAEAIGEKGQAFMEELNMDRVYDYMYHLLLEYSKLQDFKPAAPPSAQEMCPELLLCLAEEKQKQFLSTTYASPSSSFPCTMDLTPNQTR